MSRLTIGLSVLACGLVLLLFNGSKGSVFGIESDDFASMIQIVAILAVMASGLLASRERLRPAVQMLLIWFVIILSIVSLYVYKAELTEFADRVAGGLLPGYQSVATSAEGRAAVQISKNIQGHFTTNANVNGHDIAFLVDTGATDVALTFEDARTLGLNPDALSFDRPVQTANGQTFYAPVRIDSIQIGPIIRNNIRASVALEGQLRQSLLGMSFLSTLSGIKLTPDVLTLSD